MAALRIVRETFEIDPTRIRKARDLSGLSGRLLARALNVHENFVSRLERGKIAEIQDELLEAIANELHGKGRLKPFTKADVLAYLMGEVEWEESEIRPRPRLVEGEDDRPDSDEGSTGYKAWCNQTPTDLDEEVAA